jgi:Protein of unknown function (DUF2442)
MSSSARKSEKEFIATRVWCTDDSLYVQLDDGREIKVPLEFYPRLNKATPKQREKYELIGLGTGIHWPEIDEDLSVEGIVLGIPARF